jgi:hypothetical protein
MVFNTKKLLSGESIEVTQLGGKYYAKIHYQPFDKYIIVCGINFKTETDGERIIDITIDNLYGEIPYIIYEFNFLDINGNDTLSKELKENLCRSVYYNQYDKHKLPYFSDIGFSFGYY